MTPQKELSTGIFFQPPHTVKTHLPKPGVMEITQIENVSPDMTKKRKYRYHQSNTNIKHNYPNFHITPDKVIDHAKNTRLDDD
jgi:hypothetical protein